MYLCLRLQTYPPFFLSQPLRGLLVLPRLVCFRPFFFSQPLRILLVFPRLLCFRPFLSSQPLRTLLVLPQILGYRSLSFSSLAILSCMSLRAWSGSSILSMNFWVGRDR